MYCTCNIKKEKTFVNVSLWFVYPAKVVVTERNQHRITLLWHIPRGFTAKDERFPRTLKAAPAPTSSSMLTCRSSCPGSTSLGFFSVDVKPPHSLPFKLLNVPGNSFQTRAFTRLLCASGIACVLICAQSFSQGSQQIQSATSGPPLARLPGQASPPLNGIVTSKRWTWHQFQHNPKQPLLSLLLCREELWRW